MLKIQTWQPDTHPGHVLEIEWEYNQATGRDTGRPHRGVSVLYPDGTHVRDDAADAHYQKLLAEHMIKNQALAVIIEHLPPTMRKNLLDSDGDPVLNESGRPRLVVKDKHMPHIKHRGAGHYDVSVPGIDETTHHDLIERLAQFSGKIALAPPVREPAK